MLYPRLPFPPNKGEKTRAYQQLSYLSQRHRLWVACFIDCEEDYAYIPEVQALCHRFEAVPLNRRMALTKGGLSLLRGKTLTEGYYGSRAMWTVVTAWAEDRFFDAALAFSSSMGAYVEDLPAGRRALDLVDFDSHKWADYADKSGWPMSVMFRTEARRLALREIELIRRFDVVFVVNDRERARLHDSGLQDRLVSFPTLMHLDHYQSIRGVHTDKIVGYVGTMSYRPNVDAVLWFGERVWPKILQQHPDAEWWIVGRDPTREVRRLASTPKILVTGEVADVRQYLARMRVFVAPALADLGVQSKMLEALAAGRPVVTTPLGHEGVNGQLGRDYRVADGAEAFAATVCSLLDDHPACERLGEQARQFMRRRYNAETLMPRFQELLLGACERSEARA